MGKQVIILILSLLLLISGGIYETRYLENTSRYIKTDVDYVKSAIEQSNMDLAKERVKTLGSTWGSVEKVWNIFVNHERIDDLEEKLAMLKINIELKNEEESLRSSMILKEIVDEIVDKQRLTFEHVL